MSKGFDAKLDDVQMILRKGDLTRGREVIKALCTKPVKRAFRVRLAYIARQAFMPEKAMALLHPIVRGKTERTVKKPTIEERAEYGLALADLGAGREAIDILSRIDVAKFPRIFRGLSMAYFRLWAWDESIPMIERFVNRPHASVHDRLWGNFRLGLALMHGIDDYERADRVLSQLLADTKRHDYPDLHRQTLMGLGQVRYFQKRYKDALVLVDAIGGIERDDPEAPFSSIVQQLRAEVALQTEKNKRPALEKMREITAKFESMGRWEQSRGCEYSILYCTRDERLFANLYFGTPFPAARRKILRGTGFKESDLPKFYDWCPSAPHGVTRAPSATIDALTGETSLNSTKLKTGQVPQRILQALCADFYRPVSVYDISARAFSDAFYNPVTSPLQVRQGIWRLRQMLKRNRIPLEIHETNQLYRLRAAGTLAVRVRLEGGELGRVSQFLEQIGTCFKSAAFSADEAARVFAVSPRAAVGYLREAVAAGAVERLGTGPGTRYRLL